MYLSRPHLATLCTVSIEYRKLSILTMAAAPLSPPYRFCSLLPLQAKSRDTFCLNGSCSKMLGSSQMRAGEILKRGGFGARERDTQRPLKSPSFGSFLGEQEKNIRPHYNSTQKDIHSDKQSPVLAHRAFCNVERVSNRADHPMGLVAGSAKGSYCLPGLPGFKSRTSWRCSPSAQQWGYGPAPWCHGHGR